MATVIDTLDSNATIAQVLAILLSQLTSGAEVLRLLTSRIRCDSASEAESLYLKECEERAHALNEQKEAEKMINLRKSRMQKG